MNEETIKLKIDIQPEMNAEKQKEVLDQVSQIKQKYADVTAGILAKEGETPASEERIRALSTVADGLYSGDDPVSTAVRNLGRVFSGVIGDMSSQLKTAFEEPVSIFQHQMAFIAKTYNKTTEWSNKTINQVAGAQAYATDYARRINQMSEQLFQIGANGEQTRKSIGSSDAAFFRNFESLKMAYLAGLEEVQHKGALPRDLDAISLRMSRPDISTIYGSAVKKTLGDISEDDIKSYTKFMTYAALPFHLSSESAGRHAPYIKKLDSATPYGHLPEAYQRKYLQAWEQRKGTPMQLFKASAKASEQMVDDKIFEEIQKLAEEDKTGVINELAIKAGLVDKVGHKLTWRNRGSEPQIRHFAALLPVELEKLKSGTIQYREDSLEADRWNKRSVVVDKAIEKVSKLGIQPILYENPRAASTASFTGKETVMRSLGFPKQYIIPKTSFDTNGDLIYREPTEEEIRVPRGQKAGVETKNQKFVATSDSGLMRLLRKTAEKKGYKVDEELGYYTNNNGERIPFMAKVPLSDLWEDARDANGWFPEGGYEAVRGKKEKEITAIANKITHGTRFGKTPFKFGFLNQDDLFFIPEEFTEQLEKDAEAAGVLSLFQAGNARKLTELKSREAFVKQLNNVKSFNTPSHGEDEYYGIRTSDDKKTGVNPQYLNWTALSRLYELKTGEKMDKENILDSLAFVTPGRLFDEPFQGRAAGPMMKFAAVLGDLPKTLKMSGLISKTSSFGKANDEFIAPSAALNPDSIEEIVDLYRYYYGDVRGLNIPKGLNKEEENKWKAVIEDRIEKSRKKSGFEHGFMDDPEREEFKRRWLFNAADENIDMFFPDTSIKSDDKGRYLPLKEYRTQLINGFKKTKSPEEAAKLADAQIEAKRAEMLEMGDESSFKDGLIRLYSNEFKRNLDTTIEHYGGIGVVRESGAFEVNKNFMPVSMAQSLNLPYSAYAQSIENYKRMLSNWRDPAWVQRHGFESMPAYQREMENNPDFMYTEKGRSYIQSKIKEIREHMEKGELALSTPGYSALAGMTTGMALDFISKLTGNKVDPNSEVAPLFKSALLEMYESKIKTESDDKKKAEYQEIYDEIKQNKYFIAPGLKKDDSTGFYKAVAERYPTAMGTAVAGRNLYYNPDGSVNEDIRKALEATGASKDVFYLPAEAMYKMNTGDFDGDTVWAYVSEADKWLNGVEEVDARLAKTREILTKRKAIQEKNMTKEQKEMLKYQFGEEVLRASFLDTYSKGAMGLGSAVIRNALQMPDGPEKDAALLEGMEYYDLATSEIKKKGITNAKLGKEGFKALLVGQNFDRLMRNVYAFSNADDETKKDMHFPSIFKTNIGSINDMTSLGTISMNQSTAKAAGGTFALHKKMSDFVKHTYGTDSDLAKAAQWYSDIRIGDLTGEHFVTPEDIEKGYDWLNKLRQEQATKGSAGQLVYEQQIKALESALKFMESDMSTSQKNIDRELASGSNTERTKAIEMINKNKGWFGYFDEIRNIREEEQKKEIEDKRAVEELQKDERFKEIQKIFKHNPNYPNGGTDKNGTEWGYFPRRYSVTATEPWFDRTAMPRAGSKILKGEYINLERDIGEGSSVRKRNLGYNILYNSNTSFGNYERMVEAQADEIMGDAKNVDIVLGNYMHKAFENFWESQLGYKSIREKMNEKNKAAGITDPYLTEQTGYVSLELENFSTKVQDEFTKLISGKKTLEGNGGKTFASELDELGFELYKDEKRDLYQVKAKPDFERSASEKVKLQDRINIINDKLKSMQGYIIPGKNKQRVEGSLGSLIYNLYGNAKNLRVVGKEGEIYDEKGKVIWKEKDDSTQYELPDKTQITTHAKPDAVLEIDGKYYILDYKSSESGAADSTMQSLLYQKQYEERAKRALESGEYSPFSQFGELIDKKGENGETIKEFQSKFGGVIGFDARGKAMIKYSQAHEDWNGRDFIDVLKDEYLKAIQRKKDDLENGHYAAGQLKLIRDRGDAELVKYAQENGMLPSELKKVSEDVERVENQYRERVSNKDYKEMSSAETDFYIARYAQDKEQLDEIEKTLRSEKSRLRKKNNPYGSSFDRFGGIQEQIDSILGDETLSRMLEVYSDNEEIRGDIRKQMARKSNALSLLTNVRSEFAVEDVKDAKEQLMSFIYGVDYSKGGQGLVNIWQKLNYAKGTKEGLLSNPDLYDELSGKFRTENDAILHPEKYPDEIARQTERTRAELATKAEEKYEEASKEYDNLTKFVSSVGINKVIKADKEEGQKQLYEIIEKPLNLDTIDKFFEGKLNSLIGYVQQKQANIDKLTSMMYQPGVTIEQSEAAAQQILDNQEQRREALKYLENPYALADIIKEKTGFNGSQTTPLDKVNKKYEEEIKAANIRLALAQEDTETLKELGLTEDDLIKNGIIKKEQKYESKPIKSQQVRMSPYDNQIVDLRNKKDRTEEEENQLYDLIKRRNKYFTSTGVIPPVLPETLNQYSPGNEGVDTLSFNPKELQQQIKEKEDRIKKQVATEGPLVEQTKKYWNLWKEQNQNYLKDAEQLQELSMQSLIGKGDSREFRKLQRIQQARTVRENIAEQKDEKGQYRFDETERNRIRTMLSDPNLEKYVEKEMQAERDITLSKMQNQRDLAYLQGGLNLSSQELAYRQYHRQLRARGSRSRFASFYNQDLTRHEQIGQQVKSLKLQEYAQRANMDVLDKQIKAEKDTDKKQLLESQKEIESAKLKDLQDRLASAQAEFNKFNTVAAAGRAVLDSFGQSVAMVVTRLGRQLFRKTINEVKQFTKQYDKSMNEIQMITLKTDNEIASLGEKLINKALKTGSTVTEVTSAASNLYRQGLSDEEVDARLEDVIKFSKVAGIKTDEASKIITTALQNGLVNTSEEAMDALVALGDTAATTASEISKGMQKSAAAAKQAGMSYGELVTLLTIGTSKTQLGGQTIGSTLNTLIYRLYKVNKNEDFYDENGAHIAATDATKALDRIGVSMFDTQGNFRGPYQILQDIAAKWEEADDITQSAILTTLGAGRQRSNVATLLQGMAQDNGELAQKYMDTATTSNGITSKKYENYLDTLEAKLNTVKSSFDALIESFNVSGTATNFLTFLAETIQNLTAAEKATGALSTAIQSFGIIIAAVFAITKPWAALLATIGVVATKFVADYGKTVKGKEDGYQIKQENYNYEKQQLNKLAERNKSADKTIEETKSLIQKMHSSEGLTSDETGQLTSDLTYLADEFKNVQVEVESLIGDYDGLIKKIKEFETENDKRKSRGAKRAIQAELDYGENPFKASTNLEYALATGQLDMYLNTKELEVGQGEGKSESSISRWFRFLTSGGQETDTGRQESYVRKAKSGSDLIADIDKYGGDYLDDLLVYIYDNNLLNIPVSNNAYTDITSGRQFSDIIMGKEEGASQAARINAADLFLGWYKRNKGKEIGNESPEEIKAESISNQLTSRANKIFEDFGNQENLEENIVNKLTNAFIEKVKSNEKYSKNPYEAYTEELRNLETSLFNEEDILDMDLVDKYILEGISDEKYLNITKEKYGEAIENAAIEQAAKEAEGIKQAPKIKTLKDKQSGEVFKDRKEAGEYFDKTFAYEEIEGGELSKLANEFGYYSKNGETEEIKAEAQRLFDAYTNYKKFYKRGNSIFTEDEVNEKELKDIQKNKEIFLNGLVEDAEQYVYEIGDEVYTFDHEPTADEINGIKSAYINSRKLILENAVNFIKGLGLSVTNDDLEKEEIKKEDKTYESAFENAISSALYAEELDSKTKTKIDADRLYKKLTTLGVQDLQGLLNAVENGQITNFQETVSELGLGSILEKGYEVQETKEVGENGETITRRKPVSKDKNNIIFNRFMRNLASSSKSYTANANKETKNERAEKAKEVIDALNNMSEETGYLGDAEITQAILGKPIAGKLLTTKRKSEINPIEFDYYKDLASNYAQGATALTKRQRLDNFKPLLDALNNGTYEQLNIDPDVLSNLTSDYKDLIDIILTGTDEEKEQALKKLNIKYEVENLQDLEDSEKVLSGTLQTVEKLKKDGRFEIEAIVSIREQAQKEGQIDAALKSSDAKLLAETVMSITGATEEEYLAAPENELAKANKTREENRPVFISSMNQYRKEVEDKNNFDNIMKLAGLSWDEKNGTYTYVGVPSIPRTGYSFKNTTSNKTLAERAAKLLSLNEDWNTAIKMSSLTNDEIDEIKNYSPDLYKYMNLSKEDKETAEGKNLKRKIELQYITEGMSDLEQTKEILQGTSELIESLHAGGVLEIEARIKIRSDLYEENQLAAKLFNGTQEEQRETILELAGINIEQYDKNPGKYRTEAEAEINRRINDRAEQLKILRKVEKDKAAFDNNAEGYTWVPDEYIIPEGYALDGNGNIVRMDNGKIDEDKTLEYQNSGHYKYNGTQNVDRVNPLKYRKNSYTDQELAEMRYGIVYGFVDYDKISAKDKKLYDAAVGTMTEEEKRYIESGRKNKKYREQARATASANRTETRNTTRLNELYNKRLNSSADAMAYATEKFNQDNEVALIAQQAYDTFTQFTDIDSFIQNAQRELGGNWNKLASSEEYNTLYKKYYNDDGTLKSDTDYNQFIREFSNLTLYNKGAGRTTKAQTAEQARNALTIQGAENRGKSAYGESIKTIFGEDIYNRWLAGEDLTSNKQVSQTLSNYALGLTQLTSGQKRAGVSEITALSLSELRNKLLDEDFESYANEVMSGFGEWEEYKTAVKQGKTNTEEFKFLEKDLENFKRDTDIEFKIKGLEALETAGDILQGTVENVKNLRKGGSISLEVITKLRTEEYEKGQNAAKLYGSKISDQDAAAMSILGMSEEQFYQDRTGNIERAKRKQKIDANVNATTLKQERNALGEGLAQQYLDGKLSYKEYRTQFDQQMQDIDDIARFAGLVWNDKEKTYTFDESTLNTNYISQQQRLETERAKNTENNLKKYYKQIANGQAVSDEGAALLQANDETYWNMLMAGAPATEIAAYASRMASGRKGTVLENNAWGLNQLLGKGWQTNAANFDFASNLGLSQALLTGDNAKYYESILSQIPGGENLQKALRGETDADLEQARKDLVSLVENGSLAGIVDATDILANKLTLITGDAAEKLKLFSDWQTAGSGFLNTQYYLNNYNDKNAALTIASALGIEEKQARNKLRTEEGRKEIQDALNAQVAEAYRKMAISLGADNLSDFDATSGNLDELREKLAEALDYVDEKNKGFIQNLIDNLTEAGNLVGRKTDTLGDAYDEAIKSLESNVNDARGFNWFRENAQSILSQVGTYGKSGVSEDGKDIYTYNRSLRDVLEGQTVEGFDASDFIKNNSGLIAMMNAAANNQFGANSTQILNDYLLNGFIGGEKTVDYYTTTAGALLGNGLFNNGLFNVSNVEGLDAAGAQQLFDSFEKMKENADLAPAIADLMSKFKDLDKVFAALATGNASEAAKVMREMNAELVKEKTDNVTKYGRAASYLPDVLSKMSKGGTYAAEARNELINQADELSNKKKAVQEAKGKSGQKIKKSKYGDETLNYLSQITKIDSDKLANMTAEQLDDALSAVTGTIDEEFGSILQGLLAELAQEVPAINVDDMIKLVSEGNIDMSALNIAADSTAANIIAVLQSLVKTYGQVTIDTSVNGNTISVQGFLDYIAKNATVKARSGKGYSGSKGSSGGGKSAVDKLLENQKYQREEIEHQIKMIQIEEQYQENMGATELFIGTIDNEIDAQKRLGEVLKQNIDEMYAQLKVTAQGTEDYNKLVEAIWSAEEQYKSLKNTIFDLNSKKLQAVVAKQEREDISGNFALAMYQKMSQKYQTQEDFGSYELMMQKQIEQAKANKATNLAQIAEYERMIKEGLYSGTQLQEMKQKILDMVQENADYDNSVISDTIELNKARVAQIGIDLERTEAPMTHENNILSTYGGIYQSLKDYDKYRQSLLAMNENLEENVGLTQEARQRAVDLFQSYKEGTPEWYEARSAVYTYDETLAQLTATIEENRQAAESALVQQIAETYNNTNKAVQHNIRMAELSAARNEKNNNFEAYQQDIATQASFTAESIANETYRLTQLEKLLTSGQIREGTPAWEELNDSIREARENVLSLTTSYEDLIRVSQQSELEYIAEQFNNADAKRQHDIKMIQYQETKYQNAGELSNYGYMLGIEYNAKQEELEAQRAYAQQLQEVLSRTDESSDAYEKYTQEYYKLCEAIKATENELDSLEKKEKENSLAILKIRQSAQNTINDAIKNRVQREKNMLSATVQIENQIAAIIRKRYTDELALMRKRDEQNKESLNNEKTLLNERLDYKKKAIDYANKYEELSEYKKQLAILKMDSTRTKEAKELEQKIVDLQRELSLQEESDYVAARNEQIDEEIKAIDEAAAKREETTNEWLKDYANIADQVQQIMGGGEDSYLAALKEQDEWKYASEKEREKIEQEAHEKWLSSIGEIESYWDEVMEHMSSKEEFTDFLLEMANMYNDKSELDMKILERTYDDLYDSVVNAEKVDPMFEHVDNINGTVLDMSEMLSGKMEELLVLIRDMWNNQAQAEWTDYREDMDIGTMDLPTHVASQEAVEFDPNIYLGVLDGFIQAAQKRYEDYLAEQERLAREAAAAAYRPASSSYSKPKGQTLDTYEFYDERGIKTNWTVQAKNKDDAYKKVAEKYNVTVSKKYYSAGKVPKNAEGGLVDYTGLAWVDGTLTKPESFLDATDTKLLRSMLDAYSTISVNPGYVPTSEMMTTNNTTIGDINITINQAELKNDADVDSLARKIGKSFTRELGKQGFSLPAYAF